MRHSPQVACPVMTFAGTCDATPDGTAATETARTNAPTTENILTATSKFARIRLSHPSALDSES